MSPLGRIGPILGLAVAFAFVSRSAGALDGTALRGARATFPSERAGPAADGIEGLADESGDPVAEAPVFEAPVAEDKDPLCGPPLVLPSPAREQGFAVGRVDYFATSRAVLGEDRVRLQAVVRYPARWPGRGTPVAGRGRLPIVFFLHGNRGIYRVPAEGGGVEDVCTETEGASEVPSYRGFDYLLDNLAAAGFIAVSLNANDLNCKAARITERAKLVHEHIALWKRIDEGRVLGPAVRLRGRVDFARVGLFGHSRGGEAVVLAASQPADPSVKFRSVVALAPVDLLGSALKDLPLFVVLPAADGDVVQNDGARIYDRASAGDATGDATGDAATLAGHGSAGGNAGPDRTWLKAQSYVFGANHNFFNSEWLDDDGSGPNRLTPEAQRRWLLGMTRAFLELTLRGREDLRPVFTGAAVLDDATDVSAFPSYYDDGAVVLDDFRQVDRGKNSLEGPVRPLNFEVFDGYPFRQDEGAYNFTFFHDTFGLVATWSGPKEPLFESGLPRAGDVTGFRSLSFRVAQVGFDDRSLSPDPMVLGIEAEDVAGHLAEIHTDRLGATIPRPYRLDDEKTMLRSIQIPLACFRGGSDGIDLARLVRLRFFVTSREEGALAFEKIHFGR